MRVWILRERRKSVMGDPDGDREFPERDGGRA